jgi:hypothetical protein
MYLSESLQSKWGGVLDHPDLPEIKDSYKRAVTAVILENQAQEMQKATDILQESNPTNATGASIANFDPILISLVRRSLPNLIAYDVCGVQPMTGPTGLIFAMRSRLASQTGTEAFYNEANTFFSGANAAITAAQLAQITNLTLAANTTETFTSNASPVGAMLTSQAEALGDGAAGNTFQEMAFSIEKVTVTAKSRALKAEYSMELAQDLKAVHGLDAETELANILSTEILAEINREVIRTIYGVAKLGAQVGTTTRGTFDLDTDSNGRWMVEKVKGLAFQIEREANTIAKLTRRGKGNIMLCSSDVASALAMAGILDYNSALQGQVNLTVMILAILLLVHSSVASKSISIHTSRLALQMSLLLLVSKVRMPMMLVSSTAHMFRCKWFVQLTLVLSNQRLVSRHGTASLPIRLPKARMLVWVL